MGVCFSTGDFSRRELTGGAEMAAMSYGEFQAGVDTGEFDS